MQFRSFLTAILMAAMTLAPIHADAGLKAVASGGGSAGGDVSSSTVTPSPGTSSSTVASVLGRQVDIRNFGGKCDGSTLGDVTTTASSATISSASYTFTSADVGKSISISGAGSAGGYLFSTIASVSAGDATLADAASTSVAGTAFTTMGTDNSAAYTAAITAAYNNGTGGEVVGFSNCNASQIVIKRFVVLNGGNENGCFIRQVGGTNEDFVISENEAALEDSGANYGADSRVPSWMGIKNCQINGNSTGGNTAGRVIAFWGNMSILENVNVQRAAGDCIYTGASGSYAYSATDPRSQEEGQFLNVTMRNCGARGWAYHGPHDATAYNIVDAESADCGFYNASSANYNGGLNIFGIHDYAESNGCGMHFGTGVKVFNIYSDFSSVTFTSGAPGSNINGMGTIQCGVHSADCLAIQASNVVASNVHIIPNLSTGTTGINLLNISGQSNQVENFYGELYNIGTNTVGVKISNAFNTVRGQVNGGTGITGSVCADVGSNYNTVDLTSANCNVALKLESGEFFNHFTLWPYGFTTLISGTPNNSDVVQTKYWLNLPAGSATTPALLFGGYNTNSGFYGTSSDIDLAMGGAQVASWTSAGQTIQAGTSNLGVAGTARGILKLNGNTSGTVTLEAADAAGSATFKLPTSAGSNGQMLVTDGGSPAQLSFTSPPTPVATMAIQPTGLPYTSDTTGTLGFGYYTGAGGNASPTDYGLQVSGSLGADVTGQLRYNVPPSVPSGTMKLRMLCLANASSGTAKFTVQDGAVAAGASPSAVTLTSETQSSITWASGDADKYKEVKIPLTSTVAGNNILVLAITFNSSGYTQTQPMTCLIPTLIWE